MEHEPEVAVCYGADAIQGGPNPNAGARPFRPADRAEGIQQTVLRDVLRTVRVRDGQGHEAHTLRLPRRGGNVLPAGPACKTSTSNDGKGHEGAHACRVAADPETCGDIDVRRVDLEPNAVAAALYLPESPDPIPLDPREADCRIYRVGFAAFSIAAKDDGVHRRSLDRNNFQNYLWGSS